MKNKMLLAVLLCVLVSGCQRVPAGHKGIKVYLLGQKKGVESEELGVGRYFIGINEELYTFPTFTQNYVWTKNKSEGSPQDESITFQTTEGLSVNADIGISYHIRGDMVNTIFQKYRKGVEEITDIYLRNMVRDAFNTAAAQKKVEYVYGQGKSDLVSEVEDIVKNQVEEIGIIIERIYIIGSLRLPEQVVNALNKKIEATQKAGQRENEIRQAEAEAKKKIAEADGDAQSILLKAKAQAEANRLLTESISDKLINYELVKKWDGIMPKVSGRSNVLTLFNDDK